VSRFHSLISFWLPMLSHLPSGLKVSEVVPATVSVLAGSFDVVSHRSVLPPELLVAIYRLPDLSSCNPWVAGSSSLLFGPWLAR
jgi:hypothetical protein